MSEHAAAVAKHSIKAKARRRNPVAAALPVAALVLIDVFISAAVFILSYKLRQQSDIFIWKPRKSLWPFGVTSDFEPYLWFLIFVPLVKTYMLRRYGLYRLRGEFSFGNDFAKIISASTLASLVLALIAFSFRQGVAYREGHLVWLDFSYSRLVFVYDWLLAIGAFWVVRSIVRVIQILYRMAERNMISNLVGRCGEGSSERRLVLAGKLRRQNAWRIRRLARAGEALRRGRSIDHRHAHQSSKDVRSPDGVRPRSSHQVSSNTQPVRLSARQDRDRYHRITADDQTLRGAVARFSASSETRHGRDRLGSVAAYHVAVLGCACDPDQDGVAGHSPERP